MLGKSQTFPAGTYYIGDPCYAFPVEGANWDAWDEWCRTMFDGKKNPLMWNQFFKFKGHQVGTNCGTRGIIPIALVVKLCGDDYAAIQTKLKEHGRIATFEEPFIVSVVEGMFKFGRIQYPHKTSGGL